MDSTKKGVHAANNRSAPLSSKVGRPTSRRSQLEAELWAARLGFCGEDQLHQITSNVEGLPGKLHPHPFRFIDSKEKACIKRQPASSSTDRTSKKGERFYMDFGFLRSSKSDYSRPDKKSDRVIESFDGFTSYLAIVDEHSRFTWTFLCKNKEPPIHILNAFLDRVGLPTGGVLRTDEGGELSKSDKFRDAALEKRYIMEPTGPDAASQNAGVEKYNDTLGTMTRSLLYSAGLPAEYWSAALVHAAYLLNRRVHSALKITPFESWFGKQPDLKRLRIFGARVCVKRAGKRRSKLDRHDFEGIFVGYTATERNIRYFDCDTGQVHIARHAVFDEAWYLQPIRPPAAQMLYDMGLEDIDLDPPAPVIIRPPLSMYPPFPSLTSILKTPSAAIQHNIPLRLTESPFLPPAADAAKQERIPHAFHIDPRDRVVVYLSPDPYADSFEERLHFGRFCLASHSTAGLTVKCENGHLILTDMVPGTPSAKIPRWRSRIRGARLIAINNVNASTVKEL